MSFRKEYKTITQADEKAQTRVSKNDYRNCYSYNSFLLAVGLAHADTCTTLGSLASNPASSRNEIYQHNIASRINSGHYWINTTQGLYEVECKMGLQCGGVEGGWMQVVDVNMPQENSCPGT